MLMFVMTVAALFSMPVLMFVMTVAAFFSVLVLMMDMLVLMMDMPALRTHFRLFHQFFLPVGLFFHRTQHLLSVYFLPRRRNNCRFRILLADEIQTGL